MHECRACAQPLLKRLSIFRRSGRRFVEENATTQKARAPIPYHREKGELDRVHFSWDRERALFSFILSMFFTPNRVHFG